MSGFELRGGKDLARISRQLRRTGNGRELTKQYRQQLRAAAKPMVPAVRASILAIPAGSQHTGLRRRLAAAVRLTVRTSGRRAEVSVRVDGRRMPAEEGSLPSMMDGRKRWKHPVYGNRETWVTQKPHPYFARAIIPLIRRSRSAIQRATREITKEIT